MNSFWAAVALHFAEKKKTPFVSENFMFLKKKVEFTLASCFLPNSKIPEFNLKIEGENQVISGKDSFLVFVKELKALPF